MNMNSLNQFSRHPTRGTSLVELMVSILISAVGFVGIAALLLKLLGAQATAQSDQRAAMALQDLSQRIFIINEIDRLSSATGNPNLTSTVYQHNTATASNCITAACNLTDLALSLLGNWHTKTYPTLVNTTGATSNIVYNTPTVGQPFSLTVSLTWPDTGIGTSTSSYNACTDPQKRCVKTVIIP
jgi:type IV pilus assembly protein PilV